MSLRERRGTMRRQVAVPHSALREVPHTMSRLAVSKLPIAFALALSMALYAAGAAFAAEPSIPRTPRPEKARVYFITPKPGENHVRRHCLTVMLVNGRAQLPTRAV